MATRGDCYRSLDAMRDALDVAESALQLARDVAETTAYLRNDGAWQSLHDTATVIGLLARLALLENVRFRATSPNARGVIDDEGDSENA